MLKKNVLVILLIFVLAGCTICKGVKTGEGGDEPPVILDSYAAESVRPGATWRVFLKVQDADGDMHSIITQLVQPGIGYYPPDFTYIKEADREGFAFGPQEVPEKWQMAAKRQLGTIMVEIRSILQDTQGESNRRVLSP
jgi:hypothetical protein